MNEMKRFKIPIVCTERCHGCGRRLPWILSTWDSMSRGTRRGRKSSSQCCTTRWSWWTSQRSGSKIPGRKEFGTVLKKRWEIRINSLAKAKTSHCCNGGKLETPACESRPDVKLLGEGMSKIRSASPLLIWVGLKLIAEVSCFRTKPQFQNWQAYLKCRHRTSSSTSWSARWRLQPSGRDPRQDERYSWLKDWKDSGFEVIKVTPFSWFNFWMSLFNGT